MTLAKSDTYHGESHTLPTCHRQQSGFALFTIMVIVIIVGIISVSGLRQNELIESLSGNSIQRSRAIHSSEGALIIAENTVSSLVQDRVSALSTGKVYSSGNLPENWWNDESFTGASSVDDDMFGGVIEQPEYVIEEVGYFQSDGGTGIISLDRGSSSYGSLTESGREVVLYRFQAKGFGSTQSTKAITESMYVQTK